jgi:hypothetical protein
MTTESSYEVLTTAEVAAMLRVSPRTVRRASGMGVLRPIRLHPKSSPRFAREDIETLIRGKRKQHRPHLGTWHKNQEESAECS